VIEERDSISSPHRGRVTCFATGLLVFKWILKKWPPVHPVHMYGVAVKVEQLAREMRNMPSSNPSLSARISQDPFDSLRSGVRLASLAFPVHYTAHLQTEECEIRIDPQIALRGLR